MDRESKQTCVGGEAVRRKEGRQRARCMCEGGRRGSAKGGKVLKILARRWEREDVKRIAVRRAEDARGC